MKYENMFKPIKIGPMQIKNRIGMAPMNMFYSNVDGSASEQQMAYYAARAKGGTGLIVTEAVRTSMEGVNRTYYANLRLFDVNWQKQLSEMIETVHAFDSKIVIQVNGGPGPQGSSFRGYQLYAASPITYELQRENLPKVLLPAIDNHVVYIHYTGEIPREMTIEEIRRDTTDWANCCKMAAVAGADGVEIHACHGYLLHSFLSPRYNKRGDMYGGSLKNRMRFLLEVVERTREAIGPKVALGVRTSSSEHQPDGLSLDEVKIIVQELEKAGCDFYHLSSGSYESMRWLFPEKDGQWDDEAKAIKQSVKSMPVLSSGTHDPEAVEKALADGVYDMMLHGRVLIADPDWANKVKEGREAEISKCNRDLICIQRLFGGMPVRCPQNPNCGRERYMPEYWRPAIKKGYRRPID